MDQWVSAFYRKRDENWEPVDFHSHNEFEIYQFHGGICKYLIGDRIYHLQPGDIIIMNGLTLHRANPLPGQPYVRSVVQFSKEWIKPVLEVLGLLESLNPFLNLNHCFIRTEDSQLVHGIDQMIKEIASLASQAKTDPPEVQELMEGKVKIQLIQLLLMIYECNRFSHWEEWQVQTEKEHHVERVIAWIDQHFTEKISLDTIAENLNLSKYYISHAFKEITGATVMTYLMNCRLNRAKYLLEMYPEKPISQVSMETGFESFAHFSRFFRQKLGMTPTDYRKQRSGRLAM